MRLLVVDENPERSDVVLSGLKEAGYDVVATISKDDDLREGIRTHRPDLVIIDLESPYRDYLENLITINRENPRPIAMFVAQEDSTLINEAIETGVSVYVADGLSPKMVKSILQIAIVQFTKFRKLQEELDRSKTALADRKVVESVGRVAEARGIPRAQIALAWLLHKPAVTAPIIGASKPHHLEDAVAALSVKLSPEEMSALEEHYVPHPVAGFS